MLIGYKLVKFLVYLDWILNYWKNGIRNNEGMILYLIGGIMDVLID